MAEPILIYGKSGSGKSRSLRNFADDEIFFINVVGKRLPFKNTFKYQFESRSYGKIAEMLKKMPCKIAVIDDAGYLMTKQFMDGHSQSKSGAGTFDLFNSIGDDFWNFFWFLRKELPKDVRVYLMMHEIGNDDGEVKVRTIGKLLDEKVCVEGLFTICLRSRAKGGKYCFVTQSSGKDIAKSPEGMFDDVEIENDLKAVDERICAFYDL